MSYFLSWPPKKKCPSIGWGQFSCYIIQREPGPVIPGPVSGGASCAWPLDFKAPMSHPTW